MNANKLADALREKIAKWRGMKKGELYLAAQICADELERLLAAHDAQPAQAAQPIPAWVSDLKSELMRSKITHNFTLTRDELGYLMQIFPWKDLPTQAAQPVGGTELRSFVDHGVIHDRKRGRHMLGSENDAAVFGEPLQDTVDALNAMEAATRGTGGLRESYLDECRAQAQPVGVPDGWLMVPKHDVTSDMIRVGMEWITNCQTDFDRACMVTCIFGEMCKAAPQPTAQPSADAEDGFTEWLDKDWPLWITNPDNPNIARLRRAWIAARAAEGDGNAT